MRLRIFVSSTCYDLSIIRSQLKSFIENMGYEAILSEYNDIFYDPQDHTHESCVKEIANADLVILIIGSRFGAKVIPDLKKIIDFNKLLGLSKNTDFIAQKDQLSVTQYEIFKAVESGIPVYCFVEDGVMHDHRVYEQNKEKEAVIKEMKFPSIDKNESAPYIFEFITFMKSRIRNNAIFPFSKLEDIEECLLKQWSNLFQTLLSDSKKKSETVNQMGQISERLDDMKALIMSSVDKNDKSKDVAKGVLKFRLMVNYVSGFVSDPDLLLKSQNWESLLKECGINRIDTFVDSKMQKRLAIIKDDNTFFLNRLFFNDDDYYKYEKLWSEFYSMNQEVKQIIVEAIRDSTNIFAYDLKYYDRNYFEYIDEVKNSNQKKNDEVDLPF